MESMPREADHVISSAINALKMGDRLNARRLARQAASLAPELEYAWLILAETSSLKASIAYLENATRINPGRMSTQQQLHLAREKVRGQDSRPPAPTPALQEAQDLPFRPASKFRSPLLGIFTGLFVINLVFWGWWGRPVAWLASVSQGANPAVVSQPQTWAGADIPKPTRTPTVTPIPTDTPTPIATSTLVPTFTIQPTLVPTQPVVDCLFQPG
jgi:hypothetical protein